MKARALLTTLVALVLIQYFQPRAHAQTPDEKIYGAASSNYFGTSTDAGKDFDGDGVRDFVVGSPSNSSATGRVDVYSGATGTILYTLYGANTGDQFGVSVAMVDDLDGDGKPDLLVGASPFEGTGYVKGYKGSTGALLFTLTGNSCDDFGTVVKAIGDVNGDGVKDFAVAAPRANRNGDCLSNAKGQVSIYSGATHALLFSEGGTSYGDTFGGSIGDVGDVNGDGTPDFAVAAIGLSPYIKVFSGSSHSSLYSISTTQYGNQYEITNAGDVNGDGKSDFVIGNGLTVVGGSGYGSVKLISGADGSVIRELRDSDYGGNGGHTVVNIGDVNGDGVPDFLASSQLSPYSSLVLPRSVRIISGADFSVIGTLDGSSVFDDGFGKALACLAPATSSAKAQYLIGSPADVQSKYNGSVSIYGTLGCHFFQIGNATVCL